ncbi:MAG TPA: phage holin family protein [Terriglobales bacterium]|nr:phage holin family protein [Terriglobales bacterium]
MSSKTTQYPERSVADVLSEIKVELQDFIETRYKLFRAEMNEGLRTVKSAAPLAAMSVVFLVTGYLLLTLALVSLVAVAFWNSPYHWFFAFLIVGVGWMVIAAMLGLLVRNSLRKQGLLPKKTIEVLKRDKVWIQNEAKGHPIV